MYIKYIILYKLNVRHGKVCYSNGNVTMAHVAMEYVAMEYVNRRSVDMSRVGMYPS